MRLLADTHTLYWWLAEDRRLSRHALAVLEDAANEVLVSAVTACELSVKARLGKWPGGDRVARDIGSLAGGSGLTELPISIAHALLAGNLPNAHRDPFDRMLAAQAEVERAVLVTADPAFRSFGVATLW